MRNNDKNDSMNVTSSSHHVHTEALPFGIRWDDVRMINKAYDAGLSEGSLMKQGQGKSMSLFMERRRLTKSMRPDIQRLELARLEGYAPHPSEDYRWKYKGCSDWISEDCLPDYLHDLNALHDLEMIMLPQAGGKTRFVEHLRKIIGPIDDQDFFMIHSTSAQRAEAILRTFGKWKED